MIKHAAGQVSSRPAQPAPITLVFESPTTAKADHTTGEEEERGTTTAHRKGIANSATLSPTMQQRKVRQQESIEPHQAFHPRITPPSPITSKGLDHPLE